MTQAYPWLDVRQIVGQVVAQVRREVSQGSASPNALSPLSPPWPPAEHLCPNCLTACDESNFCAGCGKVVKA